MLLFVFGSGMDTELTSLVTLTHFVAIDSPVNKLLDISDFSFFIVPLMQIR